MNEGYIEKSVKADKNDIDKINAYTRSEFSCDDLYVFSVVLCDNNIDRDNEKFSVEALYQMKDLFLGKTGIFDHSMKSSDQKARVFDTWVEKSPDRKTADGEPLHQLKAKAYMVKSPENSALITEIEAGIKKEVSVSCSADSCICSVCGKNRKKEGCTHIAGKIYKGKRAFFILSDITDAYEFSFVAVPAQREAGVTKSFLNAQGEEKMTDIIKSLKACTEQTVISKETANKIVCQLEALGEDAALGREYKKHLTKEVISLCSKAMPAMDIKAFSGVAQVMTVSELNAFKKAFSSDIKTDIKPQTAKADGMGKNVNQFKI